MPAPLDATVLICTYNRAALLGETLDSLAREPRLARSAGTSSSSTTTRPTTRGDVVMSRVAGLSGSARYLFEPRQGKSNALNTGLGATIAPIDRCSPTMMCGSTEGLGGRVVPRAARRTHRSTTPAARSLPIWEAPCPPWLDRTISRSAGARWRFSTTARSCSSSRSGGACRSAAIWRCGGALIDRIGGFDPAARTDRAIRCWARNRRSSFAGHARSARAASTCRRWTLPITCPPSRLTKIVFPALVVLEGRVEVAARAACIRSPSSASICAACRDRACRASCRIGAA